MRNAPGRHIGNGAERLKAIGRETKLCLESQAPLFVPNEEWRLRFEAKFCFTPDSFQPFSSISYMATGGISHRIPMPLLIYRLLFQLDLFPKLFASFFIIRMTRK